MENDSKWPIPNFKNREKPEIPESYKLFGVEFKVKDSLPTTGEDQEDLDVIKLKKMINESIFLFKELLKTDNKENFEKIKDLHYEMNDMINKAKMWEAKILIKKMKKQKQEVKKEILNRIDRLYK